MIERNFIKFKGGKVFKFEYQPDRYENSPELPLKFKLDFPKEYFRIKPSESKEIPAFSSVCHIIAGGFKTELILPYDNRIIQTDGITSLEYERTSEIKFFPKEMSSKEKWLKTDIRTGVRNVITGGFINPFFTPQRTFIEIGIKDPFDYIPQSDIEIPDLKSVLNIFNQIFDTKIPVTFVISENYRNLTEQIQKTFKPNEVDLLVTPKEYPSFDSKILLLKKKYPWQASSNPNKYIGFDYSTLIRLIKLISENTYEPSYVAFGGKIKNNVYSAAYPWSYVKDSVTIEDSNLRCIVGGVLRGTETNFDTAVIKPWESGVTFLKNPDKREFLHFLRPGFNKDSVSPLVAGFLFPNKPKELHAGTRGEDRSCLNCSYCETICPMRLNPELLYKHIQADLIDDAVKPGLLRCSECGLCSYVCPSKLDIMTTLKNARKEVFKKQQKQRLK